MWWQKYSQLDKAQPSLFFNNWSEGHEVKDEDGKPRQVYHGTTHDFDQFDINKTGSENFMGQGFYFSDSPQDVNHNYATLDGSDLVNRIDQEADNIMSSFDSGWVPDGMDEEDFEVLTYDDKYQLATKMAREKIVGQSQGHVIPSYLKMKNPIVLDPNGGTYFEFENIEDENGDIIDDEEETGSAMELHNAIFDVAADYGFDGQQIWENVLEHSGLEDGETNAYYVDKAMRENEDLSQRAMESDSGENEMYNFIADVYKRLGFDGVSMSAWSHFGPKQMAFGEMPGMQGIHPDTKHHVVWDPTQAKSAIGNNGLYNPVDPRLTQ